MMGLRLTEGVSRARLRDELGADVGGVGRRAAGWRGWSMAGFWRWTAMFCVFIPWLQP